MITGKRIVSQAHSATDYISLSEAKLHLRVTSTADDAYITGLIAMALQTVSVELGYQVQKSTVRFGFDEYVGLPQLINPINGTSLPSGNYLRVPSRVLSIGHVYYIDEDNQLTEFAAADWISSAAPFGQFGRDIFFNTAPTNLTDDQTKFVVECTEGFELASATGVDPDTLFPSAIKHAALLLVGQMYDNRQAVSFGAASHEMHFGFKTLLAGYTISRLT